MSSHDPDFEKARSMVRAEEDYIEGVVERSLAKHSRRILVSIVGAAFVLGGFLANLKMGMNRLEKVQAAQDTATVSRVTEWTGWRSAIEDHLRANDEKIRSSTSSRFTNLDYDTAVWMAMTRSPTMWLPYFREVKKEQGKP